MIDPAEAVRQGQQWLDRYDAAVNVDCYPSDEYEIIRNLVQTVAPRILTSVAEINALPEKSVIRAERVAEGPRRRHVFGYYFERTGREWTAMDPTDRMDGEDTVTAEFIRNFCTGNITVCYAPQANP